MASASVYYKFKSQREPSRITFDGTGISVWDLKREIILQNKMGKGIDFDLSVYSADTEEEFKDDNYIIPRSSQVIVRRLPPSKPGRGSASQYVADLQAAGPNSTVVERSAAGPSDGARRGPMHRGQMSMRFDGRDASGTPNQDAGTMSGGAAGTPASGAQAISAGLEGDEASRIAAMFQATTEQWDETQERMANATYRDRPGMPRRAPRPPTANAPNAFQSPAHDRPPPIGYICFRCGTKGHWIHDCPTNDDREFDNKPRFKRTTGIPKSMLKTVEAPTDGTRREGVMVTPDGSYVIAQVDSASWARNQAHRQKRLTKSDIYSGVPSDANLACSICNKLLRDAVRTPCCQNLFCQECVTTHLLEHDFQCSECQKRVKDLTDLKRDDEVRKQVRDYVDAEMDKSEKKLQEAEQAEKEELDKARREREQEEDGTENGAEGLVKTEGDQKAQGEGELKDEADRAENGTGTPQIKLEGQEGNVGVGSLNSTDAAAASAAGWNSQNVQQIMMMLCNPQLPPPMRMQLQMQLRFLHNQFVQTAMQQDGQAANDASQSQQQQSREPSLASQQQQAVLGAHNANPFAGQHQMAMSPGGPFMNMNTSGVVGNPMVGMRLASPMGGMMASGAMNAARFQPAAPLSHQESAYMRLPVNPNKRSTTAKRERPADFLELGGGAANKEARTA